MGSRVKAESTEETNAKSPQLLHGLALAIFSDDAPVAAGALNELLLWSEKRINPVNPTPFLIVKLGEFLSAHINQWVSTIPTTPALNALTILMNLTVDSKGNPDIPTLALIAKCPQTMGILFRLSYHPCTPLSRTAQLILQQAGRFCDINEVMPQPKEMIKQLCSLFLLSNPAADENLIMVVFAFMSWKQNTELIIDQVGVDIFVEKFAQLFYFPSKPLRDASLEIAHLLVNGVTDFRVSACRKPQFLRSLICLCIPECEPTENFNRFPLTPCMKAVAFLLELIEDNAVLQFVGLYRTQIAVAAINWGDYWLMELAIKVSNAPGAS